MNNPPSSVLLMNIISILVKHYHPVSLEYNHEAGTVMYRLHTGHKSDITLHMEGNILIALTRYNGKTEINTLDDLLDIHSYWFNDATSRGWGKIYCSDGFKALYAVALRDYPEDTNNL